ncbi:rna-directed dna polymerase from mobile element jockey-like [Pitangus sulphuratus]|nr:rna-directed dna polymerase from mobile element jockey-like [Pitangus sulphuratus]
MRSLRGQYLGMIVFNIFFGDMDSGIKCILSEFAKNTKLCSAVEILEGRAAIQRDLDRLDRWADANLRKLNKEKCKVLHLDRENPRHTHRLDREVIESSSAEKELEVMVNKKLHLSQQCELTVQKAKMNPGLHQKQHGQ